MERIFGHPDIPGITVTAMAGSDEASVRAVFDGMSPHSRRMRFLAGTPALSDAMVRRLCELDHVRRGAWVALDGSKPIGIGRYGLEALPDGPDSAEIALSVIDSHQGIGVGRLLLDVLATVLHGARVSHWHWTAHRSNAAMLRLTGRLAMSVRTLDDVVVANGPVRVGCGLTR